MHKRIRRGLRIAVLLTAVVVVAVAAYVHTPAFRHTVERRVQAFLVERTGRDVRLRLNRLRPFAGAVGLEELRIAGGTPDDAPLLELARSEVDLRLLSLIAGSVRVSDLSVESVTVDLNQLPSPASTEQSVPRDDSDEFPVSELTDLIRIDRGTIARGRLTYTEPRSGIGVDADEIRIDIERPGASERHRCLLEMGSGTIRIPDRGELVVKVASEVELDGEKLEIGSFELRAAGVDLDVTATLTDLVPLRGTAGVDLELLTGELPIPLLPGTSLEGAIRTKGTARVDAQSYEIDFDLGSSEIAWGEWVARGVVIDLTGTEHGWESGFALNVQGVDLAGEARSAPPPGLVPMSATVDLSTDDAGPLARSAELPHVPTLRGAVRGTVTARAEALRPGAIRGTFRLEGDGLGPRGTPDVALTSKLEGSLGDGMLQVDRLDASGAGMRIEASGAASLDARSEARVGVEVEDAGQTLRALREVLETFGVNATILGQLRDAGGSLELTSRLEAPGVRGLTTDGVTGELALSASGLSTTRGTDFGVDADVDATIANGTIDLRRVELLAPDVRVEASGGVSVTGARQLTWASEIGALGRSSSAVMGELRAAGVPDPGWPFEQIEAIAGTLRLGGRIDGPWNAPSGDIALGIDEVGLPDRPRRTLTSSAELDAGRIDATGNLAGDGNELSFELKSGRIDAGTISGVFDARLFESSPAWWTDIAGVSVDVEGTVDAAIAVDLESATARASADLANGSLAGTPFELRNTRLTVAPGRVDVSSAELHALGGTATVEGELRDSADSPSVLRIRGSDLDVGKLLHGLGVSLESTGSIDFEALVTGSPAAPAVAGDFSLEGIVLEGQPLPDLAGPASYDGSDFAVDLAEPGGDSRVRAEGSLRAGVPWSVDARYPVRIDLDRLAELSGVPDSVVRADLRAMLSGNAGDLATISGSIEARDTVVQLGADTFTTNAGPVVDFDEGVARLRPFELQSGEMRLTADGDLTLSSPQALSVRANGTLALAPLAALVPQTRMDGTATVDLRVSGPMTSPEWDGNLTLTNGRLDHPAIPAPVDRAEATLRFAPDRWRVDNLSMRVGGGAVRGTGEYVTAGPGTGTIRAELNGEEVRMRPTEGLRLETDVDLRVDGRVDDAVTLSGRLDIARAAYQKDIELTDQLLARSREAIGSTGSGDLLDRIRLDIDVHAPGSTYLRNNVAEAEATVELTVGGTAAGPRLTGRVELLEGGRWIFRGVTYNITRGTFSYIDSEPDDPRVDLEAETSVDAYDIRLTATGRLQDPKIELFSTPSLPQADIVSLLVTGKTRDDMSSSGGGLSGTQAALYLTRDFTKSVEASLRKSLGIDELRIDPVLVEGDAEPTARLTVGKSITGDVSATYSTSIAGNEGDIYQLRYEPKERLSFVARQDEDSELSGDVLLQRKFYVGPRRPAGPDHGARDALPRVSRVTIEGNETVKTRRLRRDLGVGRGDRLRRPVLLAGVDAIRDRYVARGFPEARVEAGSTVTGDAIALDVTIDEGRSVQVILEGLGRKRRGLREGLLELWQQSVFFDAIDTDAAEFVLDRARAAGYARATAEAEVIERGPDEVALRVAVDRGPRVRVERLEVEGTGAVAEEKIRAQLLTREAGLLTRGYLSPELLQQDREAVLLLCLAQGYLDAHVAEPEVVFDTAGARAVVRIVVDEGPLYRLGGISYTGAESLDEETLDGIVSLEPGDPFVDAEIREARARLRRAYDQRGYPDVSVELRTRIDRETATVDAELMVDEGPHKVIESVEVAGTALTRPHVVEREVDVEPGAPWSADEIAATRQKLYRTGLFKSVKVSEEAGTTPDGRRLRFDVQEGKNVRTEYGIGASSDQGARARFSVSHQNLFGRRLYGSTGGRFSQEEWRAFALARLPRLFGTRLDGLLSTFAEKEEEDAFDIRRIGFTLQVSGKTRKDRLNWFVGYGLSDSDVRQEGVEIRPGGVVPVDFFDAIDLRDESTLRLGNLNTGFVASTLDDPAWPTRGQVLRAEVSWFDEGFGAEAEFLRVSGQWRTHHRVGSRTVWQVGARGGVIDPYGASDFVPVSERFFAGGDDTIRGFSNDSIGAVGYPEDELAAAGIVTTEALGGDVRFIFNQELVRPLYGPLFIAAFHDAGNIYWQIDDFDLGDLRHSAGLGVRMRTPIGPLRVEYGWKLDRESDESRGRFHFSLGMAF